MTTQNYRFNTGRHSKTAHGFMGKAHITSWGDKWIPMRRTQKLELNRFNQRRPIFISIILQEYMQLTSYKGNETVHLKNKYQNDKCYHLSC